MNQKKIDKVKEEIIRLDSALVDLDRKKDEYGKHGWSVFHGCAETGAVKRASLDLTRALADMRKSN